MIGKASEIKCMVVNELTVGNGAGIELFEITLNRAVASLGDREIIDIKYKQNNSFCEDGRDIYYETALIIFKEVTQ